MPAGSGLLDQIRDNFSEVVATALSITSGCPSLCEHSCIECLQTFRNGYYHKYLDRHVTSTMLQEWGDELDKPRPAKLDYAEARRRQAERNRAATKASQDVYPVPKIEDYERRQACAESFRLFCETYFAAAVHRAWSDDHLRVINRMEKAVREGGLFAFAMPRGSGKTTLARCAALWAILYGYRPFVCLIGAADDRAKELLIPIKKHVLENPLLLADFPEAVYPLRSLENSSKRQLQQHIAHSETWVQTSALGRVVHEWSPRPTRPDNHWFDCLVGCAAAASMCGVRTPGEESCLTRQRKRYTQDDLRRE